MIKKYRKKPVVIEAIQYTGDNDDEIRAFAVDNYKMDLEEGKCIIDSMEGKFVCSKGDYVIKGVKGEFYPCKPDIFEQTYEEVKS
jgi:hypothetical protein